MLGVEQTRTDRAVSTFYSEERNLVLKMDLGKLNIFPSFESSAETNGKNRTAYTMQKKVNVRWGISRKYLWRKSQWALGNWKKNHRARGIITSTSCEVKKSRTHCAMCRHVIVMQLPLTIIIIRLLIWNMHCTHIGQKNKQTEARFRQWLTLLISGQWEAVVQSIL